MHAIESEIEQAVSSLALPPTAFVRCDPATAASVVTRAKNRFVYGSPRAWWLSLHQPPEVIEYPDGSGPDHLVDFVHPDEARCWFVVETEQDTLPVYDVDPRYIAPVLRECRYFEYYVLGRQLTWLVAENDHNQLVISRVDATEEPALGAAAV